MPDRRAIVRYTFTVSGSDRVLPDETPEDVARYIEQHPYEYVGLGFIDHVQVEVVE